METGPTRSGRLYVPQRFGTAGPPVAFLLCGLTGSGKTTHARQLEADGAVRLSIDEEVFARHGRYGVDYPEQAYFDLERPVREEVRQRLDALLRAGRSAVADLGFWQRRERDEYKRLVERAGGRWRLLYFAVDRTELLRRLAERNRRADANALTVTEAALDDFVARFEPPVGEGEEIVEVTPGAGVGSTPGARTRITDGCTDAW